MAEVKEVIERARGEVHTFQRVSGEMSVTLIDALATLLQERDELREALRPFAEAWSEIERIYAKHGVSCEPADEVLVRSWQFTHGEYRRAARLLAGKGVKG